MCVCCCVGDMDCVGLDLALLGTLHGPMPACGEGQMDRDTAAEVPCETLWGGWIENVEAFREF